MDKIFIVIISIICIIAVFFILLSINKKNIENSLDFKLQYYTDTELLNTIEEYRSIIENNWFFDNLS